MEKTLYFLLTFLESILSVFGIRATYEEPRYALVRQIDGGIEIRDYAPRVAVETDMRGQGGGQGDRQGDSEAFKRLFDYITGANRRAQPVAMTTPVESGGERIAMTVPVEQGATGTASGTMRFFLPAEVAKDPPEPTDPRVRLVHLPEKTLAVLRFSGSATPSVRAEREAELTQALAKAGLRSEGAPFFMGYDPPFSIPFLRRNEVAVALAQG